MDFKTTEWSKCSSGRIYLFVFVDEKVFSWKLQMNEKWFRQLCPPQVVQHSVLSSCVLLWSDWSEAVEFELAISA